MTSERVDFFFFESAPKAGLAFALDVFFLVGDGNRLGSRKRGE